MLVPPPLLWVFVCKDTDLFSIRQIFNVMDTNINKPVSTRGGAREGAGRKKKCVKRMFFSASQETLDILNSLEGNKSDFINECIIKATRG